MTYAEEKVEEVKKDSDEAEDKVERLEADHMEADKAFRIANPVSVTYSLVI